MRYFAIFVLLLIAVSACSTQKVPQEQVDEFAKCLTEKGVAMYGTFWCPHCARVKKNFGPSFQYVKYVECDARGENEQSEFCIEKKIENYATFEFADGTREVGEPTFEVLAAKSGCKAPGQ
jgi:hypothetical protein